MNRTPQEPCIERMKWVILLMTLLFACLNSFCSQPGRLIANFFMVSPYHALDSDLFFAPLSMLTPNYPNISFEMLFDLLLLNSILVPLSSFVVSFLGRIRFFVFMIGAAMTSSLFLHSLSLLCDTPFFPTTLFSSVALSILMFWSLLHTKSTSTLFLFIPLKPLTLILVSIGVLVYSPCMEGDWIRVASFFWPLFYSYLVAVFGFRLKSQNKHLAFVEAVLIETSLLCERFVWRVKTSIRKR